MSLSRLAAVWMALIFLLAGMARCGAQQELWYFGSGMGLDFRLGMPRPMNDGSIRSPEAAASISDPATGELLFYTDGVTVWNRHHLPMPSGSGLLGHESATQGALIVPTPGNSGQYYIFTTGSSLPGETNDGLRYSMVDMKLDSGRGDVSVKNVLLLELASEKLTAVPRCWDSTVWVIAHAGIGRRYVAYLVSSTGVADPVLSEAGSPFDQWWDRIGYLRASSDGRTLAAAVAPSLKGGLDLLRFDMASGRITDRAFLPIRTPDFAKPYGVEFSADDSKVYVSETVGVGNVTQFDLSLSSYSEIIRTQAVLYRSDGGGGTVASLLLGPDDRIYCAVPLPSMRLDVIEFPNRSGASARYDTAIIRWDPPMYSLGLPNMYKMSRSLARASAPPDTTICLGDSLVLRAAGGVSYRWSPESAVNCADCPAPIARPQSSTRYYVEIGNGSGCFVLDSVLVSVDTARRLSLPPAVSLCEGDTVPLTLEGVCGIHWSPSAGLDCDTCATVQASPEETTTYAIQYSDGRCSGTQQITINVLPLPTAKVTGDTTICAGQDVRLHASGGVRYAWDSAEGLSCADCPDPLASPRASTEYRVTVWNDAGCSSSARTRVNVAEAPTIDAGPDVRACAGDTVQLSARGADRYVWDPAPSLSCRDCPAPDVIADSTRTYAVTGWSADGCSARDSVRVVVMPRPLLSISGVTAICMGDTTTLLVSGAERYRWWTSSGALECADCSQQRLSPMITTTYYVQGTNAEGCSAIDSVGVVVHQLPTVTAAGGEVCRGASIELRADGAERYEWEPRAGLSCWDCPSPIARPDAPTEYRVIGTSADGCRDTAMVLVSVRDPAPLVASMDRGIRLLPGAGRTMTAGTEQSIVTDTLRFVMRWNGAVAAVSDLRASTALQSAGWMSSTISIGYGECRLELAHTGAVSVGPGPLVEFRLAALLGDSTATELPFTLESSAASCTFSQARAGQMMVDSICGLDYRLMAWGAGLLKLEAPMPNPVTSSARIRFTLPFEAAAELRLVDSRGRIRQLASGTYALGVHELELDARDLEAGAYDLQLLCDGQVRSVSVVVLKGF